MIRDRSPVPVWDLTALLNALDAQADAAQRHLWLIQLLAWLRHPPAGPAAQAGGPAEPSTPWPVLKLGQLMGVLDQHPDYRRQVTGLLAACWRSLDSTTLLAEFGFAPRADFMDELRQRVGALLLPSSPETDSWSELFGLMFRSADVPWLRALDADLLTRLGVLLNQAVEQAQASQVPAQRTPLAWRGAFFDAILVLTSQVAAAGLSGALRRRMSAKALANRPFVQVARAAERVREAAEACADDAAHAAELAQQALYLRGLLQACREAIDSVHEHLDEHGVSVDIVFQVDQLRKRTHRIEALMDCALGPQAETPIVALTVELIETAQQRRSVGALFTRHYSMLARKVAERSAETGEHYITRDWREYSLMLKRALGGGSVLAGTTFMKFFLMSLALSPFWAGLSAGLNYAVSFVIVQLLHWTVATKQPAMTAPALVAKLAEFQHDSHTGPAMRIEGFVDEVAHLIRSQVAGIVGNLAAVIPLVVLLQLAAGYLFGQPLLDRQGADYVVASHASLLPNLWFAGVTGLLLFASSQIAGWAENAFVLHRIDSAIRYNPRIVARLGAERAQRWAIWWRGHISGLASNISLGLMLGLVPVVATFFALPLDVRHVTLSTGQMFAAASTLGWEGLSDPQLWQAWWWAAASIPVIALLNLSVSFYCAFRLALRSRNVRVSDRRLLAGAILRRLRHKPLSFLLPLRYS